MEGCKDKWFKQHAIIEFSTAEKIPSIDIHPRMQALYMDKCVDVSTVIHWVQQFNLLAP